jgi:hypothetical protein
MLEERPGRDEIRGADMRKMDQINTRLIKTIERVAGLEARLELLLGQSPSSKPITSRSGNGRKKK